MVLAALSCKELCRALQTNAEFAALCSGSAEPKVLSPIAAGLIAQNLQVWYIRCHHVALT